MEIAVLIVLFLIGTVASAVQAMKYLERKNRQRQNGGADHDDTRGQS